MKTNNKWTDTINGWAFALPFIAIYLVFTIYPIIDGFFFSFQTGSFVKNRFNGLGNYIKMFSDPILQESLKYTFEFTFQATILYVVAGLGLALIAASRSRIASMLRSIFYIPTILTAAVVISIWAMLITPYWGPINILFHKLGWSSAQGILFRTDPTWAPITILVLTLWWTVGFNMLVFYAAIKEIPEDLYEAARLDGASEIRSFFAITLPSLIPVITTISILQVVANLRLITQPFLLTSGGPGNRTRPIILYIYELAFRKNDPTYATAVSFMYMLTLLLLYLIFVFIKKLMARRVA